MWSAIVRVYTAVLTSPATRPTCFEKKNKKNRLGTSRPWHHTSRPWHLFWHALLFFVIPGQGLQCYNCKFGFGDLCITSKITCKADEQCYSGVGKAGNQSDVTGQHSEIHTHIYSCTHMWLKAVTVTSSCVSSAVSAIDITMKGCLPVAECNQTSETTIAHNSVLYSLNKTCCNTDLCNAAPGLPGASGVGLALATVTAVLMTQVMVWKTRRRWSST